MTVAASSPAAKLALACALPALLISIWTAVRPASLAAVQPDAGVIRRPGPAPSVPPLLAVATTPPRKVPATFAILQALEKRVAQLEKQLKQRRGGGADGEAADGRARVDAAVLVYRELISPEGSVTVEQDDDGNLRAVNRDPALTGKVLVIDAHRQDGEVDKLTIMVPAPES